jgi:PIN domain nuclease of toxin-antitoxin system
MSWSSIAAGRRSVGGKVVLDASALLALLQEEPGSDRVERRIARDTPHMSTVNLSEVVAKLIQHGMPEQEARRAITPLDLEVHDFDQPAAWAAAALWPRTKAAGLSLGDRACLALAEALGAPALTSDRSWRSVAGRVRLVLIRGQERDDE